nr:MAG TPA: hypothetical protein [Bacteriophage sp.]
MISSINFIKAFFIKILLHYTISFCKIIISYFCNIY